MSDRRFINEGSEKIFHGKNDPQDRRTIKSLVNTPLKKIMFGIQILSYFLIVGSPAIGGVIGKIMNLKAGQTAGVILGVFITGEVLFYGSLAFLGKELMLLLKDWFKRRVTRVRSSGTK